MAIGVYCKNCVNQDKCYEEIIKHGIRTIVKGLVDCDGYIENRVLIIHCRDCKYSVESEDADKAVYSLGLYCEANGYLVNDDCFCSKAERRPEE